jgi:predicted dehydrogenase
VLVEKPLGVSTKECENLRLLVPPDRVFAVGCNRRFLPGVKAAKAFASRSQSIASYSAFYYDSMFRHRVTQPNLFPLEVPNSGGVTKDPDTDWKTTNRRIYSLLTHSPHLLDLAGYLVGPIEKGRAIHRERDISPSATGSRIVSHVWHIDVGFVPNPGENEGPTGHFELVLPRHGEFPKASSLKPI